MFKSEITLDDALERLNKLFKLDPSIVISILSDRYDIKDRPLFLASDISTLHVEKDKMTMELFGAFGILQYLFGCDENGVPPIVLEFNEGVIVGFRRNPSLERRKQTITTES